MKRRIIMAKTKPISIRGIDPRLWAEFRKMCIDEGKNGLEKIDGNSGGID